MITPDLTEKQLRNLRVTLAVIIAKLKLNTVHQADNRGNFVNRDGLYHYIQSLVSHAMLGTDKLEIPDFYYDRDGLSDYPMLKQLLAVSLTELQRFSDPQENDLNDIYRTLLSGLKELNRSMQQ